MLFIYFFIYALLIAVGVFDVYMLEYFYCAVIRHQPPNVSTTRHLRQYVVNEIISNYPDAKKICELGSGFGGLARVIARNTKADVYALENMPFVAFVSKIIDILSGCKKNHTIWTDAFEYLKNEHFDVVVAYLGPTVTPKIYEHKDKIGILISLDFEIKGIKPKHVVNTISGYTIYNHVKYPHRLFIYEF